jgi:hypothetical protein
VHVVPQQHGQRRQKAQRFQSQQFVRRWSQYSRHGWCLLVEPVEDRSRGAVKLAGLDEQNLGQELAKQELAKYR